MGVLKRVQTITLLQLAAGTFIAGAAGLYLVQKKVQHRVRSLEHYQDAFRIISTHEAATHLLGPPIQIGMVDLADRLRNYVGETDSKLRIPVSGKLSSGFVNVHAVRPDPTALFKTHLVELETLDSNIVIYENPTALNPNEYCPLWQIFGFKKQLLMAYSLRLIYGLLAELTNMTWPEFMQPYVNNFVEWVNSVLEYWDLEYLEYLLWLFLPIFVAFVLPILILFFIYGSVIFVHVYGLRHRIREAYASSYWDGARTSLASFWDGVGYLWHGYECNGLDNIPDEGPALFVTYHGTLPIDIYYLISKCILYKKRTIHVVGDKFVFKIPGWGALCKVFCVTPGTVEDCVNNLKEGNLLIIAPGGVREALFSNPVNYQIMWGRRLGFAKVVLGANCPVIPMFTENARDSFRTPRWGRKCFRGLYEKTRLPICPIYGGFPVKMISHLGKPISFSEDTPLDDIKHVVKNAVADLIRQHQRLPGSIFRGMWQRFKNNRYNYPPRDIPLLDRNTTNGTTQENGGISETIVVETLERGINEIQQVPLRPRQTEKDVESIGYGPELDPLALDDEHDPELKDNDESIDRL